MMLVFATPRATLLLVSLYLLMLLFSRVGVAAEPLVNINHAQAEELAEKLSGIGPAKARAIVVYRELHGPFKSVDELTNVKGIGPRTLEKLRVQIMVDARDRLAREHNAIAAIASGNAGTQINSEKETRRAVQSAIQAARRAGSAARKH